MSLRKSCHLEEMSIRRDVAQKRCRFYWDLYPHAPRATSAPASRCERQSRLASPNVTTRHMRACTTSAPAFHGEKQSRLASPNVTTHATNSKKRLCPPSTQHSAETAPHPRPDRAAPAPHTASHTTRFHNPVHSALLWKHRDSHSSLLSNLHIVTSSLSHLMTELVNCELPLASYYLPLDWAIQFCAASWLLYHLTALVNCELLLDYSTVMDWASQLWATSSLLYNLTELVKSELLLDYFTTCLS